MNDIHQEWRDLRAKNGEFLNHLDCAMAKLEKEKKQVELKRREQLQDIADAGAFTMQFAVPFNCCQDDRDILKTLNKAQADRIKQLEDKILAYKEQKQIDLAVAKEVDEKLAKATADYRALWVENDNLNRALAILQSQLDGAKAQCENQVISSSYMQQGMQSKIAKQANEIKQLTGDIETLNKKLNEQTGANARLTVAYDKIYNDNKFLQRALETSAEDAKANFDHGRIKGMEEIWGELKNCYYGRPIGENEKIFGYCTVGEIIGNLSPTWFINKAEEHRKQKEQHKKDIQIGDEVEIFDGFYPDDDQHSDIGIVVKVDSDKHTFIVVGPNLEGCFDETDIQNGDVRKTGHHFDPIPLDYFE